MSDTPRESAVVMDDGMTEYIPGVNCINCGRFVGRDGSLSVEYFEMSSTIASVDGTCRRCLDRERSLVAAVRDHLIPWAQVSADGPLTILNLRNVIWNATGDKYSPDEVQRALWRRDPRCAACRAIKRVEEATDVVALADFLNGDAARDVTGSWGFTTTTGDEFRADLLGVLDV